MSCRKYTENDFAEDYLLGKLGPQTKQAYELHLSNCPDCRARLEKETELVAAFRAFGHAEMKREIAQQAEEQRAGSGAFSWQVLTRAAAALVILLLGPGLLHLYFDEAQVVEVNSVTPQRPVAISEDELPADALSVDVAGPGVDSDRLPATRSATVDAQKRPERRAKDLPGSMSASEPSAVREEKMMLKKDAKTDRRGHTSRESLSLFELAGTETETDRADSDMKIAEKASLPPEPSRLDAAESSVLSGMLRSASTESTVMDFQVGNTSVEIYFNRQGGPPGLRQKSKSVALPDSFVVQVLSATSGKILLSLDVPRAFPILDQETVTVTRPVPSVLRLQIGTEFYRIELRDTAPFTTSAMKEERK